MLDWSSALSKWLMNLGLPEEWALGITFFVGALVLAGAAPALALVLIHITRKSLGRIQDRLGPNRAGPWGIWQGVADAAKLLTKEDIRPAEADIIAYTLAPLLTVFGVIMSVAVLPFANGLIGADLNVGVLYLVALGSVGIFAAIMAGWSSNNKYALLAGSRVVAQLMSYEIPMVLAMLAPVLLAGTMRMNGLAQFQRLEIFGFNLGLGWIGFIMPAVFLIYFTAALAEGEQTPFDLLEAESELIAGFHIEYSGMKFAMFFLAQFLNSFFLGAIAVVLFLGGWQGPFVDQLPILGVVYFFAKAFALYMVVQWIKGTFPRVRIDQMMAFAWKVAVPLMLVLILWQMIALKLPVATWMQYLAIFIGNVVALAALGSTLAGYFRREQIRTKRAFEPKSLIGTMRPVSPSGD
ncbi:MAG: NADH-quinone oxidoreductase subunit H [Chloroflexi bacterium]|nr:MAG: NADH-quinone oxidoreductase subunit H [Chloroflexota bacterium]